jgi:HD-GYP domain-containing protein (c-di-GMP phosphodiesterase class II)
MPKRLIFCNFLFMLGTVLIVISQFNGLYYIFDAENRYQRAPMYFLSVIIPTIMVILQISMLLQHRARLRVTFLVSLLLSISLPSVASIVQIFTYGLSLTNMTMVFMVVAFYMYMIIDLSKTVQQARVREVETQKNELEMFEQTTEALANAIESKDKYTSGHSSRVAMYSRLIAKEAGFDDQFCEKVYYSALLHDVGKIGVKDDIINKPGRLTDDEYDQIKLHPTYGYQILSSIKKSPYLSIGAHYHHERYDGKGYPDGLAGEEIPKIARIIAVADSFDAMTSSRSYRDVLTIHKVKEELINGMGTQFDPKYAEIMLRLLGGGVGQQTGEK